MEHFEVVNSTATARAKWSRADRGTIQAALRSWWASHAPYLRAGTSKADVFAWLSPEARAQIVVEHFREEQAKHERRADDYRDAAAHPTTGNELRRRFEQCEERSRSAAAHAAAMAELVALEGLPAELAAGVP